MKRKIALLDDWVTVPGSRNQGPVQHVAPVAEILARMGYQVDIFTSQSNKEMPEVDPWQETVRLIHVPVALTDSPEDFSVGLQKSADFIVDFCERQEKPYDLIHAGFRSSGLLAAEIKSRLGIPFVITFQSLTEGTPHAQETGITVIEEHMGIQDRVVWDADGIIALSLQDRQALISLYHADPTYIIQIPDQTDVPNRHPSSWHAHAEMLAAFYEDVLAVRRVTILPQTSALSPWNREGLEWNSADRVDRVLDTAWQSLGDSREGLGGQIVFAANLMRECSRLGGRILVCSDEADLAIARQFCADLTERAGLPAFVLAGGETLYIDGIDDREALGRYVETVGQPGGDLFLGINMHGNAGTLAQAFRLARAKDMYCISLSGEAEGECSSLSDVMLQVPGVDVQRVQEALGFVLRMLSDLLSEAIHPGPQLSPSPLFDSSSTLMFSHRLVE